MLASRIRGSVYRKKEQGGGGIPSYYKMAQDSDFSGTSNGRFKYIGTDEYIIIPDIIKGVAVTSYWEMFRDYAGTQLKGVASLNINVTNMESMFYGNEATTLDLSSLDTSNVTNMWGMFYNAYATSLDLSNFDTSNVTNMFAMFYRSRVTTLDLSSFDTSKAPNMNWMFREARTTTGYARTQADANRFNASGVKPSSLRFVVKP